MSAYRPRTRGAPVRRAQRVRTADRRGAECLGHADPEVSDGERHNKRHRRDPVAAGRGVRCPARPLPPCPAGPGPAGARPVCRAVPGRPRWPRLREPARPRRRRRPVQQVRRRAAELSGQPGRAGAGLTADVRQPRQQARGAARAEDPAGLVLGASAALAVDVHAVRARRGVAASAHHDPHRVHRATTPAKVLRRYRVRGQEGQAYRGTPRPRSPAERSNRTSASSPSRVR